MNVASESISHNSSGRPFERREADSMTSIAEPFYRSSNGDCWSLIGKPDGSVVVRHEANAPSGGAITEVALAAFLARDGAGPEHQILASLVSTMPDFQFLPRRATVATPAVQHAHAGQLRAARGLLGWSIQRAATEADIDPESLRAMESGALGEGARGAGDERRLISAFERGGIAFISDGAVSIGGSGVRLTATGTSGARENDARDDDTNDNDAADREAQGSVR
jgi:hypothetical protein